MKIPEYFKDYELACKCGCGKMPDKEFVRKLYIFRLLIDEPITPTSVARCEAHNKSEGGSPNSAHLVGAADIAIPSKEKEHKYLKAALDAGMNGIGINDNRFMHLDDKHETPAIWTY